MMIFDKFPSLAEAERFAVAAKEQTSELSIICRNWEEFDRHEAYPFEVHFPAVLVPRMDSIEDEELLEELVLPFGGEFSGT